MSKLTGGRLTHLCRITHQACAALSPMVNAFYVTINDETSKKKSDASYFTIADGMVQHLLTNHLFGGNKFQAIVGEEDAKVQVDQTPFQVDDLTVPLEFNELILSAKSTLNDLSQQIDSESYLDLSIFIDPIDGTREFSTGLGQQCSICIGFADGSGLPVAGLVYRPITPPTYAMGAKSEGFFDVQLDIPSTPNTRGFLTSNGGISPFIVELIKQLGYERVPSGGAGNKMLMLLEGKGAAYIQDRGVSRWDTCAAQAVIEAKGGVLAKLVPFVEGDKSFHSYTYRKSELNLDFIEGVSNITPYNARDKKLIKKGEAPRIGLLEEFAPYSNVVGLLALSHEGIADIDRVYDAVQQAKAAQAPSYD